jgi:hypothetical protein
VELNTPEKPFTLPIYAGIIREDRQKVMDWVENGERSKKSLRNEIRKRKIKAAEFVDDSAESTEREESSKSSQKSSSDSE